MDSMRKVFWARPIRFRSGVGLYAAKPAPNPRCGFGLTVTIPRACCASLRKWRAAGERTRFLRVRRFARPLGRPRRLIDASRPHVGAVSLQSSFLP